MHYQLSVNSTTTIMKDILVRFAPDSANRVLAFRKAPSGNWSGVEFDNLVNNSSRPVEVRPDMAEALEGILKFSPEKLIAKKVMVIA